MSQRRDPPKGGKEDKPIFKQGRPGVINDENTARNAIQSKTSKVAQAVQAKEAAIAAEKKRLAAKHMREKRQKRMDGDPTWPIQRGGIGKALSPSDLDGKNVESSYDNPLATKPTRWSTTQRERVETQENPIYKHPSREHLGAKVNSYDQDENGGKVNMYPKSTRKFSEDNPTTTGGRKFRG